MPFFFSFLLLVACSAWLTGCAAMCAFIAESRHAAHASVRTEIEDRRSTTALVTVLDIVIGGTVRWTLRTTRASTATRILIRADLHNELTRPDLVSTRPDLVSTLFHSTSSGITRPDVVPLCFHSSLSGITRPDLVFTRPDLALLSGTFIWHFVFTQPNQADAAGSGQSCNRIRSTVDKSSRIRSTIDKSSRIGTAAWDKVCLLVLFFS